MDEKRNDTADPDIQDLLEKEGPEEETASTTSEGPGEGLDSAKSRDEGENEAVPDEKYLRLYAEFENFKKLARKEKEETVKYANESLMYDLLPSLDNLEIALKHAGDSDNGVVQGVEATLRELQRTLEKFGLVPIRALGEPFDPAYHHAVSQAEREGVDENMVVEELRRGYTYRDKVLRASMVVVSRRPSDNEENVDADAESGSTD